MLHQDLTGKILEGCFEVSKELGVGFVESVYEKALLVALRQKG
jgi:GxxExxY protein